MFYILKMLCKRFDKMINFLRNPHRPLKEPKYFNFKKIQIFKKFGINYQAFFNTIIGEYI